MLGDKISWKASSIWKFFIKDTDWSFSLNDREFRLSATGLEKEGNVQLLDGLRANYGLLSSTILLPMHSGGPAKLKGLSRAQARRLVASVTRAIQRDRVYRQFDREATLVHQWHRDVLAACKAQLVRRGWLGSEFVLDLQRTRPDGLEKLLTSVGIAAHLAQQSTTIRQAIRFWQTPIENTANKINEKVLARTLESDEGFFDSVEKSPLTMEQKEAVIRLDNRSLLIAAAGSGKTSVMVAKAGYALRHGYFQGPEILLLAFNKDAATELQVRIRERLGPLGLPADQVAAKTFHALGLDIIGRATGKRPSLAPWVESGQDQRVLLDIVDELKDSSLKFRATWDIFRLVFGHDLPTFGKEAETPDSWDSARRHVGFRTLKGDVVKSRGELLIANWLFYNGVRYEYEASYEHDTADATHRQYQPDFYLPDANAYLEHWAVDDDGEPPAEFVGYKEGMVWKRKTHAEYGTVLLETTMAGVWSGASFDYLTRELPKLGIALDPNPDRPVTGLPPIKSSRLIGTFRTFLTHVKSNRLTVQQLRDRLASGAGGRFRFRHRMFLALFESVWVGWEDRLRDGGYIDFDDMLNSAVDYLEAGHYASPYSLIMVDEFQDTSHARARLVAHLSRGVDKYLFCVGDDWQSINRFAGSDLSVMTNFEKEFGTASILKMQTTFRFPPSLCQVSSQFVSSNPRQIAKEVVSLLDDIPESIQVIRVDKTEEIHDAVRDRINTIAEDAANTGKRASIYLLGRYRYESKYQTSYDRRWVDVTFLTVHGSKGLEADHIIVPSMIVNRRGYGFPSQIEDDPVLQLAMPDADPFESAEERRLFYVAMTRARKTVTLITVAHMESAFIIELVDAHGLTVSKLDGSSSSSELCPICNHGFLVERSGPYGAFLGCGNFPRCRYTRKMIQTEG